MKGSVRGASFDEGSSALAPPAGPPVQRSAAEAFTSATEGPGGAVPYRAEMERSFGESFSGVSAHLGRGVQLSALDADGAASGETVAFRSASPSKAMVAHELAHVVQHRMRGSGTPGEVGQAGSPAEKEADAAAQSVATGRQVQRFDREAAWLSLGTEPEAPGDDALKDPAKHPEWPKFLDGAKSIGIGQANALRLWTMIIEGIRDNKPDNFEQVADELFPFMQIPKGKMALWSGGIGTSDYAISKGKQTLEAQKFYKLTDGLKLYKDWGRVRPVWAALSRKFVSQCQGEVHCYLRGYSDSSIFGEFEHNILLGKGAGVTIKYHALNGPDADIRELDINGERMPRGGEVIHGSLADCRKALEARAAKDAPK